MNKNLKIRLLADSGMTLALLLLMSYQLVGEKAHVWLHKENVMDIHNGKTMLTFLDTSKDYKLYDEQNRVVTTKKGDELYTHYDKVESSVRERYEKVQKEQKKTTKKKTVTTRKER